MFLYPLLIKKVYHAGIILSCLNSTQPLKQDSILMLPTKETHILNIERLLIFLCPLVFDYYPRTINGKSLSTKGVLMKFKGKRIFNYSFIYFCKGLPLFKALCVT